MMYNMSMLRHRFSNERWGGGGGAFFSYSVNVYIEAMINATSLVTFCMRIPAVIFNYACDVTHGFKIVQIRLYHRISVV